MSLLMLGLLSILLLVGFALFQRLRSHTHTVTLLDQSLVLRNLLESQAGDVFQFMRRQANHKGNPLFTLFRQGPPGPSGQDRAPAAGRQPPSRPRRQAPATPRRGP